MKFKMTNADMKYRKVNNEVYYHTDEFSNLEKLDVDFLISKLKHQKRVRICMHKDLNDDIHEMLIAMKKRVYVRPHKHLGKSESMSVVSGSADAIFFDEEGNIKKVIEMGDYSSGKTFYYRIDKNYFHTLIIKSKTFVFREVVKGPFDKSKTVFAEWSPQESSLKSVNTYRKQLEMQLNEFKKIEMTGISL